MGQAGQRGRGASAGANGDARAGRRAGESGGAGWAGTGERWLGPRGKERKRFGPGVRGKKSWAVWVETGPRERGELGRGKRVGLGEAG